MKCIERKQGTLVKDEPWSDQTTAITVITRLAYGFAAAIKGLYRPWLCSVNAF